MTNLITIDLSEATDGLQLLSAMGEQLCLGGPGGNHPVSAVDGGGWGCNWNALADSLCYLDSGGIWGTSPVQTLPLLLRLSGTKSVASHCPDALDMLQEILLETKEKYAQRGLEFAFELDTQVN